MSQQFVGRRFNGLKSKDRHFAAIRWTVPPHLIPDLLDPGSQDPRDRLGALPSPAQAEPTTWWLLLR
jgi:hypothetical protein